MPHDMLRRLLLSLGIGLAMIAPVSAQDASELVVRLGRVENVTRQLSGQIEQLQFENRQLKEQLRKFQEDVEFRLQEGKGGGRAPAAAPRPPASASPPPAGGGDPYGTNPGTSRPGKRGDAFDPGQSPGAPGAPRQLGNTVPSAPLSNPPVTQADLPLGRAVPPAALPDGDEDGDLLAPGPDAPVDLAPPTADLSPNGEVEPSPSTSIAATGSDDARADFENAYSLVQQRQYEQAEMSLRQFIQSHPRDKLVPKATYWLGESYLQRNRSREAAEQFLKVSTDYAASPVAPEAMLKLGAALSALGAKAQACATLAEVERKFPGLGVNVRQSVEREQKRARCAV